MNFIDEKHTRHYVSLALLTPLSHFGINLLTDLVFDLASVTRKKCKKSLLPTVDHINLVQIHGVDHLFAFLQFTLRTLNEACLRAHSIVISGPCKRSAQQRDLAGRLINCDDITRLDLFLLDGLNHLLPQVVHRLHLSGLQGHLAEGCGLAIRRSLNFDLDNLSLDDLGFFSYSYSNGSSESLREGFRLGHFQRENLRASQHCEWRVIAQSLCHAHSNGSLASSRLTSNEHCSSSNLLFLNHGQNHSSRTPSTVLPDHALRHHSCIQGA
mmetsp:Transcript_261/g.269  ORF Transcript_261/g.269 Transcript_261/m.269 type:complete len:269 (+) Transcript_261:385-1191(+)